MNLGLLVISVVAFCAVLILFWQFGERLPQLRWPWKSPVERRLLGDAKDEATPAPMRFSTRELFRRTDDLRERVKELEEGQEDLERGAHDLMLTHIKAWHSPVGPKLATPATDLSGDTETPEGTLSSSNTLSIPSSLVNQTGTPIPSQTPDTSVSSSSHPSRGEQSAESPAAQTGKSRTVRE